MMLRSCCANETRRTKIRSVFVQRETLETWLRQMAIKGWIVKDFSYIFFDSFLFFRFVKTAPRYGKFCIYDVKYLGDEDIFTSLGWKLLLEHESTMIFITRISKEAYHY